MRYIHVFPPLRGLRENIFQKYFSPQMTKKSDSKWAPLATAPIFGQAPREKQDLSLILAGFGHTIRHTRV